MVSPLPESLEEVIVVPCFLFWLLGEPLGTNSQRQTGSQYCLLMVEHTILFNTGHNATCWRATAFYLALGTSLVEEATLGSVQLVQLVVVHNSTYSWVVARGLVVWSGQWLRANFLIKGKPFCLFQAVCGGLSEGLQNIANLRLFLLQRYAKTSPLDSWASMKALSSLEDCWCHSESSRFCYFVLLFSFVSDNFLNSLVISSVIIWLRVNSLTSTHL